MAHIILTADIDYNIMHNYKHIGTGSTSCRNGDVRLVNGRTNCDGRVEVCMSERWCSVCGNNNWNENAAKAICRELRFLRDSKCIGSSISTVTHVYNHYTLPCKAKVLIQ